MSHRNVVLVTVDSLRRDSVGFLSESAPQTPVIDDRADGAAIASTTTTPSTHTRASVPAILSSQYAHNFFNHFFGDTEIPHLGSILGEHGYETAGIHSNPLLSSFFGYDEGFDTFYDSMNEVTLPSERLTTVYSKIKRLLRRHPYEPADEITDRALEWLDTASEPYFLWVHYMDPHGPYRLNPERGYLDKLASERLWYRAVRSPETVTDDETDRLLGGYRNEVKFTDGEIGRLLSAVENDTAVVLTGDHGEEFGEHGGYTHHKKLYDEIVQVPFVLDLPTETEPVDGPYSSLDIVPTLCSYLDIETDAEFVGDDLLDETRADRECVLTETNTDEAVTVGVRSPTHKLIAKGDEREFYDLQADPDEQSDLSGREGEAFDRFESILAQFRASTEIGYSGARDGYGDIDPHTEDRLRDLGYVD